MSELWEHRPDSTPPEVKLIWVTPDAENVIGYCARVSNPTNQENTETIPRLLRYCFKNKHFSIFEMASMCLEIKCSRAISRQVLRHCSFSFQEFSQRYAAVPDEPVLSAARRQDAKNRQNSIADLPADQVAWFKYAQESVWLQARQRYDEAIARGVAKECARVLLPEGLAPSTFYMSGTIRSWIHYCEVRCGNGTQLEHQEVARKAREILLAQVPSLSELVNLPYSPV